MCKNMRINTSGKKAYRDDLYERTADVLDENTKTGAIDAACVHTKQDIEAKREALNYLSEKLAPEHLKEIAEILSTDEISLSASIKAEISVGGE